ncbi:hypothetical protein QQS21_002609 [Conoideocrella luteorostrata]|uniref:N-acetyltransferase domain-containing protein n=1 Tax=Conoideocrella luteorostrata TaxID=1105319 RepID=A0AAJ0CV28_9HYPO|nr:hypothetical protein QQS21_002609 [Conoideocrella luteorostrata]
MFEPSGLEWVTVKTTLPATPYPQEEIRTTRLVLRKFRADDLQSLFEMRAQPEVAAWTPSGKPETDIENTRSFLQKRLDGARDKNCTFVICLATTGEYIGHGGAHTQKGVLGWPEVGYSLRKEHWGKGYATEFLRAFLQLWRGLPRAECEIRVDVNTVDTGCIEGDPVSERLVAITAADNKGSRSVLAKNGFGLVKIWRTDNMREEGGTIDLLCYATTEFGN